MEGTMTAIDVTPDLRDESPAVRETLSALGRLLGAATVRPVRDLRSFLVAHLGVATEHQSRVCATLSGVDVALVEVAVGRVLDGAPGAVLADDTGTDAPGYSVVQVDVDQDVAAPDDLAAYLPAVGGFGFDAVLVIGWSDGNKMITLHVRRADQEAAGTALSELLTRARGADNFYRGKTLRVVAADWGVQLLPVRPSVTSRDELLLADSVWREVDTNVRGLVRNGDVLRAAGLGASRGLLLVGAPGVGKTALCRVIASELPAGTTVLLVDGHVSPTAIGSLYRSLEHLAPAAVFFDDLDLLAGDRRHGSGGAALRELLVHLDGFVPTGSVVTVATTNDATVIDPALVRSGRFDAVIEVGLPDERTRSAILCRYLSPLGSFDVSPVAAITNGATGSDLREIIRRAVLERGTAITVAHLLEVARSGRWKPQPPTGQYL
jgi:predicted AAA+ superfamily ATPase